MSDEFLPRAHSKRLGELERSNWKSLRDGRNFDRIDPAIREIVSLLNKKGYLTFSSCSGGHPTNPRWKVNRHESGYLAFSPPPMWPSRSISVFERRIETSRLKRRRLSMTEMEEIGRPSVLDSIGNCRTGKNTSWSSTARFSRR